MLRKTAFFSFSSYFRCCHRVPRVFLHILGISKSIFETKVSDPKFRVQTTSGDCAALTFAFELSDILLARDL